MSTDAGQNPQDTSSNPDDQNQNPPPPSTVSEAELETLKKQLKDTQRKARDFERQLEAEKIAKLTNEKNWEEIARLQQQKAEEAETKLASFSSALVLEKKMSAIKEAALKVKIKPHMMDLLESLAFDDVIVETTSTGRIQVLNADKAIERVKLKYPDMFGSVPVSVNATSPETHSPSGSVTMADVRRAEEQWKKTRSQDDAESYKKILIRFKNQA